jgi:hypothetical protein
MIRMSVFRAATLIAAVALSTMSCIRDREHDLKLTFLSHQTGKPIPGVTVVVHDNDGTSFDAANVKTSGADGKVVFRKLDKSMATISIAHDVNTTESDVATYVGFPVRATTMYLSTGYDDESACDPDVQVSISGVPTETSWLELEPLHAAPSAHDGGMSGLPYAETVNDSAIVCPEHVQDDGKLSLLAVARDDNANILRYGFLTDQASANDAGYDITLEHAPVTLGWTTNAGVSLDFLAVDGLRKGVLYWESAHYRFGSAEGTSGTIDVPRQFPFERHFITAVADDGSIQRLVFTSVEDNDLDRGLTIEFDTSLAVSQFTYDAASRKFTWALASGEHDAVEIFLQNYDGRTVDWHVVLPPGTTSWTIPDLPLDDGVKQEIASGDFWSLLSVADYSSVTGYSDLMAVQFETSTSIADVYDRIGAINRANVWLDDDMSARARRQRNVQPLLLERLVQRAPPR